VLFLDCLEHGEVIRLAAGDPAVESVGAHKQRNAGMSAKPKRRSPASGNFSSGRYCRGLLWLMQCFASRVVFLQQHEDFGVAQGIGVTLDEREEFIGAALLQCNEQLPGDLRLDVGWMGHVERTTPGSDAFPLAVSRRRYS
jgi:hypothetical protein